MTQPKKVLIAEDDMDVIETMIGELQKSGFDLGGRTPEEIVAIIDTPTGIATIGNGVNEVYFVSHLGPLEEALKEINFDSLFLDGLLADYKGTYEVAQEVLTQEQPPLVVLISKSPRLQFDILQDKMGDLHPYRERRVLEGSFKNPFCLAARVREFLGIEEPPEPVRERKKKPERQAKKPEVPKKVLIAISDSDLRVDWLRGLQEDGVELGDAGQLSGEEIEKISQETDRSFILNYGIHELYFVGNLSDANEIAREKKIDLAHFDEMVDGNPLCGFSEANSASDKVMQHLLTETDASVVSIARDPHAHCERIKTACAKEGRLTSSVERKLFRSGRKYKKNRTNLANLLGFRKTGAPVVKTGQPNISGCNL